MKKTGILVRWLPLWLVTTAVGSAAAQAPRQQKPPDEPAVRLPALLTAKPLKAEPKDDALRKLLKARYNEAVGELKALYEEEDYASKNGVDRLTHVGDLHEPWHRLVEAGLELCDKPAEKVALLSQYLEVAKEAEKLTQARYDAGRVRSSDLHQARYERLDAEILLLRTKREADQAKKER
jgi:hypothetical protein